MTQTCYGFALAVNMESNSPWLAEYKHNILDMIEAAIVDGRAAHASLLASILASLA